MSDAQIPWTFTPIPVELDSYGLDPYTYRVLSHIFRRQRCFASLKNIAALCGMSVRQAQNALKTLELNGMVEKLERRGKTNIYVPTSPDRWKQPDYPSEIEAFDAQDYFNRSILRRERKDFQGALSDLRKSLELYEQERFEAEKQGKAATRKKQDIRDTQNEILRLVQRKGKELNLNEDMYAWINTIKPVHSNDSDDPSNELEDLSDLDNWSLEDELFAGNEAEREMSVPDDFDLF